MPTLAEEFVEPLGDVRNEVTDLLLLRVCRPLPSFVMVGCQQKVDFLHSSDEPLVRYLGLVYLGKALYQVDLDLHELLLMLPEKAKICSEQWHLVLRYLCFLDERIRLNQLLSLVLIGSLD